MFLQNLAPGATARAGLGAEELQRANPGLVVCDISGYGVGGPYESMKAYDLMVQSEAGLLSVTGHADEMAKVGISVSDIAAGMYAYSSILAALLERGRTGRGALLDVSMLEATVEWMGFPLYYAYDGAPPPPRAGAAHATIYPYGPFTAGDGKVVMMAIQNEREWRGSASGSSGTSRSLAARSTPPTRPATSTATTLGAIIAARFASSPARRRPPLLAAVPVALRPGQHHARRVGAPAAGRPRPVAPGRHPGRRGPGAARPASSTRRRGWTRCRRWASTPGRSSPSWASPRPRSTRC